VIHFNSSQRLSILGADGGRRYGTLVSQELGDEPGQ
jgi:hypothetical protein